MNIFIEFSTADIEVHQCLRLPPSPACMRDPACNRGPASIGTSESDPRPVCGAWRLSGAQLLSEVLRYIKTLLLSVLSQQL